MLQSISVHQYRCLRDLTIPELARINLFGGNNNSGKSSLLEALLLLTTADAAKLADAAVMGNVTFDSRLPRNSDSRIWTPLFSDLDTSKNICVSGKHASLGSLKVEVSTSEVASNQAIKGITKSLDLHSQGSELCDCLVLKMFQDDVEVKTSTIQEKDEAIHTSSSTRYSPLESIKLDSHFNPTLDTEGLSNLRVKKQSTQIVDALRRIDQNIQTLEPNFSSRKPMIWDDIGLDTLLPLALMGEGLIRIVRLAIAIVSCKDGVVLVDEIENGIHYSALPNLWKVVAELAHRNNVQVFASTHSYECVAAGVSALRSADFRFHRLETKGRQNRCVPYSSTELSAAMAYDVEVR